jgi:alkylated DNA repair dioxygenase AlkB
MEAERSEANIDMSKSLLESILETKRQITEKEKQITEKEKQLTQLRLAHTEKEKTTEKNEILIQQGSSPHPT